jgi:hypothetical protein
VTKPRFVPTEKQREQVETLAGLMVPQETIARFLEIDSKTLRKYFRNELDNAREKIIGRLKGVLYQTAMQDGSIRAASYLLDRMGAWPVPENAAGAPQQVIVRVHGGTASGWCLDTTRTRQASPSSPRRHAQAAPVRARRETNESSASEERRNRIANALGATRARKPILGG